MASDTFTRADETPLAAPWVNDTVTLGNINLVSNTARASGGDNSAYYAAAATSADQYSQADWVALATDIGGPAVRVATGGNTYFIEGNDSVKRILKYVANSLSVVSGDIGSTPANPVKLTVEGSTLRSYFNSVQTANSPFTDPSLTTGQPGMLIYNTTVGLDNWSGGDVAPPSLGRIDLATFPKPKLRRAN